MFVAFLVFEFCIGVFWPWVEWEIEIFECEKCRF